MTWCSRLPLHPHTHSLSHFVSPFAPQNTTYNELFEPQEDAPPKSLDAPFAICLALFDRREEDETVSFSFPSEKLEELAINLLSKHHTGNPQPTICMLAFAILYLECH